MSFPGTYAAIQRMVSTALLETPVARAIARKGLRSLGLSTAVFGVRTFGLWNALADTGTARGFFFEYEAGIEETNMPTLRVGQPFNPNGAGHFQRYGDSRDFGEARLILNVTEAGVVGSTLYVDLDSGGFVGGRPELPLDVVGMHVSEWFTAVFPTTIPPDSAIVAMIVRNPSLATGTVAVGVVQLQKR